MSNKQDVLDNQRPITRLCAQCALLLLQHGAETTAVENLSTRLGIALGVDSVESLISANAVVLTTISDGHCLTTTRRSYDRGINMHVVTEVQHLVIQIEKERISWQNAKNQLESIEAFRYPGWLVSIMVGAACACFCRLAGGVMGATITTFVVSALAMSLRLKIAHAQINPIINFGIAAFFATALCGLITEFLQISTPTIAMASSILLLVPGFPLINAISDMFKGHIITGIARWTIAFWLVMATCIGVVAAVSIFGLKGWV